MKTTERGYAGHFICAHRCTFTRNTLIEHYKIRVVVSTVGAMLLNDEYETIGFERYYETMAFHAKFEDPYWEADVSRQIDTPEFSISKIERESDKLADEMHERNVQCIIQAIKEKTLGELECNSTF